MICVLFEMAIAPFFDLTYTLCQGEGDPVRAPPRPSLGPFSPGSIFSSVHDHEVPQLEVHATQSPTPSITSSPFPFFPQLFLVLLSHFPLSILSALGLASSATLASHNPNPLKLWLAPWAHRCAVHCVVLSVSVSTHVRPAKTTPLVYSHCVLFGKVEPTLARQQKQKAAEMTTPPNTSRGLKVHCLKTTIMFT